MSTKLVPKPKVHSLRAEIIKKLKETLDRQRFAHSLRVEKIALALGKKWKVAKNKIILAALLHDCARRYNRKELLRIARKIGLEIDAIRKSEPKLFHAEISAYLAKKEFGIKDPKVLQAIKLHTLGATGMSKLEKIIYLSDHIEEGRRYAGVKKVRSLTFKNLDKAMVESTSAMLNYLLRKKVPIYPTLLETRNYYLFRI